MEKASYITLYAICPHFCGNVQIYKKPEAPTALNCDCFFMRDFQVSRVVDFHFFVSQSSWTVFFWKFRICYLGTFPSWMYQRMWTKSSVNSGSQVWAPCGQCTCISHHNRTVFGWMSIGLRRQSPEHTQLSLHTLTHTDTHMCTHGYTQLHMHTHFLLQLFSPIYFIQTTMFSDIIYDSPSHREYLRVNITSYK